MFHSASPQPEQQPNSGAELVPVEQTVHAEYYLNLGKNLYQSYMARSSKQDLEAAIHHFQKAVEIQPNMAEAYIELAGALWEQGAINLELAQFYCETAIRLDPKHSTANLYLGYFLQRAGFFDDAALQYELAIRKKPVGSARPRIALGSVLLKQSLQARNRALQVALATKGIVQFSAGCALIPFDRHVFNTLSDAFSTDVKVYTLGTAAKVCHKLKLTGIAHSLYKIGSKMVPQEPLFHHLLGDACLIDQNRPHQAVKHYQEAQALDPQNVLLLKKLGRAYAQMAETEKAQATFSEVINLDSEDFDALYQMGQLHTEARDYFSALYYFKEAEKRAPRNPYVHSNMAYVLFKMDDLDGAFEKYRTALDFGTDPMWMATVSQTLGTIAYQVMEDPTTALEYLHQSLHYNPDNLETLAMLADLYFETAQLESALSAYKAILRLDSNNADCYSNIGYILWQMDHNDAAVDAYNMALKLDPHNAVAYNNLGVIYLDEFDDNEAALPLFLTALSIQGDYTLACFNAGRAMENTTDRRSTAQYFSRALEMNQLNPELNDDEIQSRLDSLFH